MKDMSNSSASSSLNQVDGGVIHVTDRSHKYNAGWYRDEFAPVRFIRAGFYITRRQSDKCKVVQRYAPLSEYFRRGAFILLMVMSDKSGWYRAGAPLHGYFPWRRFFILFSNQEVKMNFSKAMKAAVIIFTGAIAAAGLTACSVKERREGRIHRGAYRRGSGIRQVPGGRNPYDCRRNQSERGDTD